MIRGRGVLLAMLVLPAVAAAYSVEVLQHTGPASQRIDVVILGDGYRVQDQTKLTSDAEKLTRALFLAEPWRSYQSLFNVRVVHVISNENGADYGEAGGERDTALGAYFNCANVDRLLCVNNGAVAGVLAAHAPDYDVALIVVNDPKYGGSGGTFPTSSTNQYAADIVIHELGHSVAGLADEYETPYPGYAACSGECPEANATLHPPGALKWQAWVAASTPVPTPEGTASYANEIGLFEGCRYQTTGVYRPKDQTCRMNALTAPYCSVCGEQLIKSFWNRIPSMFDGKSPAAAAVGSVCGDVAFTVLPVPVSGANYSYAWYVDGVVQPQNANSFLFTPGNDAGTVTVRARDNTTKVRSDPKLLLEDSFTWTVRGDGSACVVGLCDVSAACTTDGGCDRVRKSAGAVCGQPSCVNGATSWLGTCDGQGGCTGAGSSLFCGAYRCDDAGVACRTGCDTDDECIPGATCLSGLCRGSTDAGVQMDAGVVGPPADAGEPPVMVVMLTHATDELPRSEGCGCSASSAVSLLLALSSVVMARRRRSGRG